MLSAIEPLVPLLFVMCAILNINDKIKFRAAVMFCAVSYLNTVVTFQNAAWFYYAGAVAISLLVYTFLVSGSQWARLLTAILLSSTFVSLLGLVNFNVYHSDAFGNMVDLTVIVTTFLELAVLAVMSKGILDSDKPNSFREFWYAMFHSISNRGYRFTNKAQAR